MIAIDRINPNCTEVQVGPLILLFAYNTVVAAKVNGRCYRTAERFSATTSRHVNAWTGDRAETVPQEDWTRWLYQFQGMSIPPVPLR